MEKKVYVELPPFTGRNVPIAEIAAAMHKDASTTTTAPTGRCGRKSDTSSRAQRKKEKSSHPGR